MHYEIHEGWKRYEITKHLGNVLAVLIARLFIQKQIQ